MPVQPPKKAGALPVKRPHEVLGRSYGDVVSDAVQLVATIDLMNAVRTSASQTVVVDAGARVVRVVARVAAAPPVGPTRIDAVAEVRSSSSGFVIDFGKMRSVTDVHVANHTIKTVSAWQGAAFAPIPGTTPGTTVAFSEVLTERLYLTFDVAPELATVQHGLVTLTTAPSDLELTVAGKRVWFQAGEAKRGAIGTTATADDYFVASIDLTEAVAAAVKSNPPRRNASGHVVSELPVELRASTAGTLALAVETRLARVYTVDFPGAQKVLDVAGEGAVELVLPLPTEASGWRASGLSLTAVAKLDAIRVQPATGPALSTAAELIVDLDHPLALCATAELVGAFAAIAGVRVPVRVDRGSAELGGVLLADDHGAPGAALPGGELTPVQLQAGASGWQTLSLRRPMKAPSGPVWIALQAAHGTAALQVATAGGAIRRGRVGGPWRGFTTGVAITPYAALRLVGTAPEGRAIDALSATFGGATAAFTPTTDGRQVNVTVDPAIPPSGGNLAVALVATAAGSYRFQDVQVFYQLAQEPS